MDKYVGRKARANVALVGAGIDEGQVFTLTAKHCETWDVASWLSSGAIELVGAEPAADPVTVAGTGTAAPASAATNKA